MHYIRFLKPPSAQFSKDSSNVRFIAKITVTTDLGESFASVDLPLAVYILDRDGVRTYFSHMWKSGYRQLEISISRKRQGLIWPCRLLVEVQGDEYRVDSLSDVFRPPAGEREQSGRVLSVMSEPVLDIAVSNTSRKVQRLLRMSTGDSLCIWEETGESIARHVWDAGLILSAYLESYIMGASRSYLPHLPKLQRLLFRPQLQVLELGSGCGIVGIVFSMCFPQADVTLTDLPQAQEIALFNISALSTGSTPLTVKNLKYHNLDWGDSLPETLRNGELNIVLVADCTYNPDVVPELVTTLAAVAEYNPDVLILLAMKIRHDSEMIFFGLMAEKKLKIVEKCVLSLPLLGQDDEEIQIYLFADEKVKIV